MSKAAAKKASGVAQSAKTGKTVTIKQIGSPIARQNYQEETLKGLGLNKMHRVRTLEDTPSVRGMIKSVQHLLEIVEEK